MFAKFKVELFAESDAASSSSLSVHRCGSTRDDRFDSRPRNGLFPLLCFEVSCLSIAYFFAKSALSCFSRDIRFFENEFRYYRFLFLESVVIVYNN